MTTIRIAICPIFLNAGGTTRGVEIARGLRKLLQEEEYSSLNVDVRFVSNQGPDHLSYEHVVTEAGFVVEHCEPAIDADTFESWLEAERSHREMFSDEQQAEAFIKGTVDALQRFQPTIVVHSLSPFAALAAKIIHIPSIFYGPLPLTGAWIKRYLVAGDIPDAMGNSVTDVLPHWARQTLMRIVIGMMTITGRVVKAKQRQSILFRAAGKCGWEDNSKKDCVGLMEVAPPNHWLVFDLASNYDTPDHQKYLGETTHIVGPVFADSSEKPLPDTIERFLSQHSERPVVFLTMGSSGEKAIFLDACKALCCTQSQFVAIIAVAPRTCSLADVEEYVGCVPLNVYLTDEFLPIDQVDARVDAVLMHGGQGTVQTALAAGTPIVGIAFQPEQQFNLNNAAEKRGAGIRLTRRQWTSEKIIAALERVVRNPSYKTAAMAAQEEIQKTDARREAAKIILSFAKAQQSNRSKTT